MQTFDQPFEIEKEAGEGVVLRDESRRPAGSPIRLLIELGVLLGILVSIWKVWQSQQAGSETTLMQQVQRVLDQEHHAILNGDGELF